MSELRERFDAVYREGAWNGTETRSGPGSGGAATEVLRLQLVALAEELGAQSVLDVGCGEAYWQPELPGYLGLDVSAEAIVAARRRHPDRAFAVWDPAEPLPEQYDLVICRDALQHLSLSDGGQLIGAILSSGARWLLASTYRGGMNREIVSGADAYAPDLTAPPCSLPEPARYLPDGYDYAEPGLIRDRTKLLGLWRLRP